MAQVRKILQIVFVGVCVVLMAVMSSVWWCGLHTHHPPAGTVVPRKSYQRHHRYPLAHRGTSAPNRPRKIYFTTQRLLLNRKRLKHEAKILKPEIWKKQHNDWLQGLPPPTDFTLNHSLNYTIEVLGQPSADIRAEHTAGLPTTPLHHDKKVERPFSLFTKHKDMSNYSDWRARGKWQEYQVTKFCQKHGMADNTSLDMVDRSSFFRRILYDNSRTALFCFIPKVGCTNMKISILIAQQHLSRIVLRILHRRRDTVELKLERALQKASLMNTNLTNPDLMAKITSFKRFVILRHPLDRLVSAFRDKLGAPLVKNPPSSRYNYFEELKHAILLKFHPNSYQVWKLSEVEQKLYLPFSTFIRWLIDSNEGDLNEHFQTQFTVCQPCLIQYSFYGDFRRFSDDGLQILNQFTSDVSAFDQKGYHSHKVTRLLLHLYYGQLKTKLKQALWRRWEREIEFYHTLYPNEQSFTEKLLGQYLQNR